MQSENVVTVVKYDHSVFLRIYIIGAIAIASAITAGILVFVYSLTPQEYWFSSKSNPGSSKNEGCYIPDVTLYYTGTPNVISGEPITGAAITDITFGNGIESGGVMRYAGKTKTCLPIATGYKATGAAYLAAAILATVGGVLMIWVLICPGELVKEKYQVSRALMRSL